MLISNSDTWDPKSMQNKTNVRWTLSVSNSNPFKTEGSLGKLGLDSLVNLLILSSRFEIQSLFLAIYFDDLHKTLRMNRLISIKNYYEYLLNSDF